MAGGEGTRLRPLTSNQPKPMVPVAGKPCMQHIIELLRRHGMTDIVVTVAYLPQVIRGYFDDGEALGVELHYSVEERPLGTAGSVKNAEELLDETFLVISGDALCDFDLDALIETHKSSGVAATHGAEVGRQPARVRGRHPRFGRPRRAVPGEAVVGPGVLGHDQHRASTCSSRRCCGRCRPACPTTSPSSSSPTCSSAASRSSGMWSRATGRTSATSTSTARPTSTRSTAVSSSSSRGSACATTCCSARACSCPTWSRSRGRPSSATSARSMPGARVGPYTVLGPNVVVKEGATVVRSMVDSGSYVGRSARLEGTILGKGVDVRAHAVLNDGVAVGDECSIGAEAVLAPGVKVYPFKTIEAGAAIHANLIWESRGITTLFGRDGVAGLVNVDITSEVAARLGVAYGTTLPRGARVVCSRDAHPSSRMVKRAIIAGLVSTGVHVADLRVAPPDGEPARAEGGGAGRRPARARRHRRPRRRPDQLLRAARDPGGRIGPEGDRADVLAAGVPPGEPGRDRLPDLPGPRHRELRPGAPGHARPRRHPRPRVPARAQLRPTRRHRSCCRR